MPPFAGYADFKDCVDQNQDKDSPEGFCAWLHYETTGEFPGEKELEKSAKSHSLFSAAIAFKDEEKRIAYGAVLVPNEPDTDGDIVSPEAIEFAAHEFLKSYGNIDVSHSLNNVGVPVESYLLPQDMEVEGVALPKGTWVIGVYVEDDETWAKVKSGRLTGFSVMGVRKIAKSKGSKVTLEDLGDWLITHVSLVEEPAVPKAKFLVVKEKKEGFLQRLLRRSEKQENTEEVVELDKEQVKALIEEALAPVVETLNALNERLVALEEGKPEEEVPKEEVPKEEAPAPETKSAEDVKVELAEVKSEIEEIEKTMKSLADKLLKPVSKALRGQDGERHEETSSNRDLYGRRRS